MNAMADASTLDTRAPSRWRPPSREARDTLRQVVWKKAARTGEMISRETAGAVQREMHFQWSQAQGLDTEARLSRIAAWVVAADAAGHAWSLQLPGTELAPDNGSAHRHAALQALARW